jgi:hypothetical protein
MAVMLLVCLAVRLLNLAVVVAVIRRLVLMRLQRLAARAAADLTQRHISAPRSAHLAGLRAVAQETNGQAQQQRQAVKAAGVIRLTEQHQATATAQPTLVVAAVAQATAAPLQVVTEAAG